MSFPTMPERPEREGRGAVCDCTHRVDVHGTEPGTDLHQGCPFCDCPLAIDDLDATPTPAPKVPESDEEAPVRPRGPIPAMGAVNTTR